MLEYIRINFHSVKIMKKCLNMLSVTQGEFLIDDEGFSQVVIEISQ